MIEANDFKDTVKFEFEPGLPQEKKDRLLNEFLSIRGVFAIAARAAEPETYDVEMAPDADSVAIGCRISHAYGVKSTTITPAAFHALTARYGLPKR